MISSRRAKAVLTAAGAPVMILMLAQCDRERPETPPEVPVVAAPTPAVAALGRAEIIAALARAASAHAAGEAPGEALTGRRFSIRLPFGCHEPTQARTPRPGLADATWSADGRTLELRLTTADWLASGPVGAAGLAEAWATADGIWINRPWLSADTCPPRAPAIRTEPLPGVQDAAPAEDEVDDAETPIPLAPTPLAPTPQSAGLVLYSPVDGSRIGRRDGVPYVHVIRGEGDAPPAPSPRGWRVVLEGRIGAFPDGRAIHCRAEGLDRRPVCIAAVQVDKVAFEEGASGRQLAEWRPGG